MKKRRLRTRRRADETMSLSRKDMWPSREYTLTLTLTLSIMAFLFLLCAHTVKGGELHDAEDVTWRVTFTGEIPVGAYEGESGETELSLPSTMSQERLSLGNVTASHPYSVKESSDTVTLVWEDIGDAETLRFTLPVRFRRHLTPVNGEGLTKGNQERYLKRLDTTKPAVLKNVPSLMGPDDMKTLFNHITYLTTEDEDLAKQERTIRLAAMLREADIPTRFVYGLHDEGGRNMNPHMWLEAHVDKQGWFPVDMTDGQVGRIDTTHIALRKSAVPSTSIATTRVTGNATRDAAIDERSDLSFSASWTDIGDTAPKPVKVNTDTFVDTMAPGSHTIIELEMRNTGTEPHITYVSLSSPFDHLEIKGGGGYIHLPPQKRKSSVFKVSNRLTREMMEERDGEQEFYVHDAHSRTALSRPRVNVSLTSSLSRGVTIPEEKIDRLMDEDVDIIEQRRLKEEELDTVFANMSEDEKEKAKNRYEETHRQTTQVKYATRNSTSNTTTIRTSVFAHHNLSNVSIYERIPKCLATEVSQISSEERYEVLKADPLIVWNVDEIRDHRNISYKVIQTLARTNCSDKALTATVAQKIAGEETGEKGTFNPLVAVLVALALVMIVLGGRMLISKRNS